MAPRKEKAIHTGLDSDCFDATGPTEPADNATGNADCTLSPVDGSRLFGGGLGCDEGRGDGGGR